MVVGVIALAAWVVMAPFLALIPPPEEVDACRLLTEEEVEGYRGFDVSQSEPRWARQQDDFDIATCEFTITDPGYDLYSDDYTGPMISLTVTDPIPTEDMYIDEWEELIPLQTLPGEAYAVVTETNSGPQVLSVFAHVDDTHTVNLSPSLLGLPDDPEAVELLGLAVSRLRALGGGAEAAATVPTTMSSTTSAGPTVADEPEDETLGGLGDPVRVPTDEGFEPANSSGWLLGASAVVVLGLAGVVGTRAFRRRRWGNAVPGSQSLYTPGLLATLGERASLRAAGIAETLTDLANHAAFDDAYAERLREDADEITGGLGEMRRAYGQEHRGGYEIELQPHHLRLVESVLQSLDVRPTRPGSGSPLSETPPFDPQRMIIRFDPATGSFSITEYSIPPSAGQIQAFQS